MFIVKEFCLLFCDCEKLVNIYKHLIVLVFIQIFVFFIFFIVLIRILKVRVISHDFYRPD